MDSFYNFTKIIDNLQHDPPQSHCIDSCNISSSILTETSRSIKSNLQAKFLELKVHGSSATNSPAPENQIIFENHNR